MNSLLRRFVSEEQGQDMIEYGLLALFIAIAGWATWSLIADSMNITYGSWDQAVQELWEPPDPGAGG